MTFSIQDAIQKGSDSLRAAGINDWRREAGSLLSHVLGRDRAFLLAHPDGHLTNEQANFFQACVARRAQGEPQQYITGRQEFFRGDFEVTRDVLIPRPETEAIVEVGLELLEGEPAPFIADIGTGSGCIVVSFLKERTDARAVATDISPKALAVAVRNARRLEVSDRLALVASDVFSELMPSGQFSLIVSNPPYIPERDWANLPHEVRDYEPRAALVSGADGLKDIRRLLQDAPQFLHSGGHLIFEIGFGQEEAVRNLIDLRTWQLIEVRRDLQGIPRTMVLRKTSV